MMVHQSNSSRLISESLSFGNTPGSVCKKINLGKCTTEIHRKKIYSELDGRKVNSEIQGYHKYGFKKHFEDDDCGGGQFLNSKISEGVVREKAKIMFNKPTIPIPYAIFIQKRETGKQDHNRERFRQ